MIRMHTRLCGDDTDRAAAMAIRFTVFVDEQKVPAEEEPDAYDADALHILALDSENRAIGTARIVDKGDGIAKIGRVAVLQDYRGSGVGRLLMLDALERIRIDRRYRIIILDAQTYVIPFYEKLGFVAEGDVFDDAGIPHRRMTKVLSDN